ncbi:hypothetical protein [Burkholderia sp. WSM2232]|uniref:hypothetical protein n=1 Tax=Burkholderia sp. WSM2232 TaxID=944436 RepID=UPI00047F013A|nr:hypothetical protein [Burkholderia sp. WSM2232]
MKIRILTLACVSSAAVLLAACTAVYKNSDACEQLMRSKLAETSSDTLKIRHTGAGIDGSRVVVEGSIEHVMTASEVAAARAASAVAARTMAGSEAGATAATTARKMSGTAAQSRTEGSAGNSAGTLTQASAGTRPGATASSGAYGSHEPDSALSSSPSAASEARAAAQAPKSDKPKKVVQAAAAECTFHGPVLGTFSWLAPAKLAAPSGQDESEADE